MILPPSRRQCSRGWASPGCRTGWWRRRLPMGHCSRCWRPALRCVSPSTRYGRRGRGCRKKRGRRSMPCGKGYLLPQHLVSAERYNRHLWRRRFSDSVQATGALYAIASATRPSGTGGTAVQRAAGDTQYLRRPADVAVDPGQGIDNQLLIMGLQSPRGNGAGAARYASGSASGVSVSPSSARASITFRTLCSWRTFPGHGSWLR